MQTAAAFPAAKSVTRIAFRRASGQVRPDFPKEDSAPPRGDFVWSDPARDKETPNRPPSADWKNGLSQNSALPGPSPVESRGCPSGWRRHPPALFHLAGQEFHSQILRSRLAWSRG